MLKSVFVLYLYNRRCYMMNKYITDPNNMHGIAQILRTQMTFWAEQFKRYSNQKLFNGLQLQIHTRPVTRAVVQRIWYDMCGGGHLGFLHSLILVGKDISNTIFCGKWFKCYGAICACGGHFGFSQINQMKYFPQPLSHLIFLLSAIPLFSIISWN